MDRVQKMNLSDFRTLMFERKISIRNMVDKNGKPINKILAFWRRNELLPFVEEGEWIKISLMQLIWIRILDDLRDINFPVEKMKSVCNYFFRDAYNDNLPKKNIEFNQNLIQQKRVAGTQSEEEDALLLTLDESLNNERLIRFLNTNINYLSNFVANVIASEQDGLICIFFDGKVAEYDGNQFCVHSTTIPPPTNPHIRLSITHYLIEFIKNEEISSIVLPQLLNEDEIKVLREMRKKNVKEITITQGNNGKTLTIKSSRDGILTKDETELVKEIFGLKNYESLTIDTIDEKTFRFKKTRKKI